MRRPAVKAGAGCRNCVGTECDCGRCGDSHARFKVCPVAWHGGDGCQHPHEIYTARAVAPDGRQAAVFACIEHLPLELAAALNGLRRTPPDGIMDGVTVNPSKSVGVPQ